MKKKPRKTSRNEGVGAPVVGGCLPLISGVIEQNLLPSLRAGRGNPY
jgi:hypothetical protein